MELTLGGNSCIRNINYATPVQRPKIRQFIHRIRKIWILSGSGKIFRDILSLVNQFLVGNISQRTYECSFWWNRSGRGNRGLFVSPITFSSQIQDKRMIWRKFETFSLFMKDRMKTAGMIFINSTLISVVIPSSICMSNTSRINTSRKSKGLFAFWYFILFLSPNFFFW